MVRFTAAEQNAPVNFKDNVFLVRETAGDTAFSARCPHLGCTLRFDEASQQFQCPCHGSVFSRSGEWLSGPAEKNLRRIPLERKEGEDIIVTVSL
jgi:Rieske Fe-S protein